jgi:hypothetical protein
MSHARIFRYFKTSPEIIRLAVMMYIRGTVRGKSPCHLPAT